MTYNTPQQAYAVALGTTPTNYTHIDTRDPTTNDTTYSIGKFWLNISTQSLWFLNNQTTTSGFLQADWIKISSAVATAETLQGNSGGPVSPTGGGTIFTIGNSPINVIGNPGTNTLTWSSDGTIPITFNEDSGSATAIASALQVVGGTGISTTGDGLNKITINALSSVPLKFTTDDTNHATPAGNNVNLFGSPGITTTSGASTVTFHIDGAVVGETITGDSGGALNPTAGNWNIIGGTGCNTSGAVSTLTINVTGGGISWVDVTAATQSMAVNTGYTANRATLITFTLPATAAYGSILKVCGKGTGGWTIHQNLGQTIIMGTSSTTPGVGGSISSTNQYDVVELLCTVADTTFTRLNKEGNITVV